MPRSRVERAILECVETDLLNPKKLEAAEALIRAAAASEIVVDHRQRIAELGREIDNLSDAIAKGLVSDTSAGRLRAAEAERARD